jgi:hypothetical protein
VRRYGETMSESNGDDDEKSRPLNRWDCPGVFMIGDRVIWDGEAEYLGLEPLKTIPVAEDPPQRARRPGQDEGASGAA